MDHPGIRVLVVDDSVDLADSIALLLSASGACEAKAVYDTESALGEAVRFAPHVVVLDIHFDNFRYEGLRLVQHLSTLPQLRKLNTRFVAMSGYAGKSDRRKAKEAGFHAFFPKPVDIDELIDVVRQAPAGRVAARP